MMILVREYKITTTCLIMSRHYIMEGGDKKMQELIWKIEMVAVDFDKDGKNVESTCFCREK